MKFFGFRKKELAINDTLKERFFISKSFLGSYVVTKYFRAARNQDVTMNTNPFVIIALSVFSFVLMTGPLILFSIMVGPDRSLVNGLSFVAGWSCLS